MGLRVLVVDDHVVFSGCVRTLLAAAGCEIVGCAAAADEALDIARAEQPDVVLLDVSLAGSGGQPLADRLGETCPVVLVSGRAEADHIARLRGGRWPFLTKERVDLPRLRDCLETLRLAPTNPDC